MQRSLPKINSLKNPSIKHVFFDLDHTLWDFEKNSALTFKQILPEFGDFDHETFISHYVPINLKYWEDYRMDKISQRDLRYGRLRDVFNIMEISIADENIDFLSTKYIEILPLHNHLFDGALHTLDYLREHYALHIITNGFADVQKKKIDNSGITSYFSTFTNSESSGCKKPNPVIYEHALNLAKAAKSESIMIGDCIVSDVRGALDFGIDAIHFSPNGYGQSDNLKRISHLSELKNYL